MNNCKQNDCGWCYDKSGGSNDINGACLAPNECAVNNWISEESIDQTGHNGECDAPVYRLFGKLYRINPVNRYALTWTGKKWIESQKITNEMVRLNGFIK